MTDRCAIFLDKNCKGIFSIASFATGAENLSNSRLPHCPINMKSSNATLDFKHPLSDLRNDNFHKSQSAFFGHRQDKMLRIVILSDLFVAAFSKLRSAVGLPLSLIQLSAKTGLLCGDITAITWHRTDLKCTQSYIVCSVSMLVYTYTKDPCCLY